MDNLFRGKDGEWVLVGPEHPKALIAAIQGKHVPGTLVGGVSKTGKSYARFELAEDAPREELMLRVIYLKRLYKITVTVVRIGDFVLVNGEQAVRAAHGVLVHAMGVRRNGDLVSFPAFHKKLSEVPNCKKCPFWATDDNGDAGCQRLGGWQPAGLYYLNQPQCSAEERSRQGIKTLKVFDYYDEQSVTPLGEAVWFALSQIRNSGSGIPLAPVSTTTPEERVIETAQVARTLDWVIEYDQQLAEAGCEWPLWNSRLISLETLKATTESVTHAAKVVNLLGGLIDDAKTLKLAIEEAKADLVEMESLDWLLEQGLV